MGGMPATSGASGQLRVRGVTDAVMMGGGHAKQMCAFE